MRFLNPNDTLLERPLGESVPATPCPSLCRGGPGLAFALGHAVVRTDGGRLSRRRAAWARVALLPHAPVASPAFSRDLRGRREARDSPWRFPGASACHGEGGRGDRRERARAGGSLTGRMQKASTTSSPSPGHGVTRICERNTSGPSLVPRLWQLERPTSWLSPAALP